MASTRTMSRLHSAAARGATTEVTQCLAAGDDINCSSDGFTPLTMGVGMNQIEVVKTLLKAGADTSIRGPGGWGILGFAAFKGHSQIIPILIDAGVDVNEIDDQGNSAGRG